MSVDILQKAISKKEATYQKALERLSDGAEGGAAGAAEWELREAIELVRCLRRLLAGRSREEIHRAFGAPGDFGYGTPIGDALAKLYRGPDKADAPTATPEGGGT